MPRAGRDGALSYSDVGQGPAILFIPGFAGLGSFWEAQVAHLSSRFRVLTLDLRGSGGSERTRCRYSIGQMTDDAEAVLDAAGLSSVVLVGHSTGGAIAQMLAARAPQRVRGLVLSSTWVRVGNYLRRNFEFRRALLARGETQLFHQSGIFFRYPPIFSEENDAEFDKNPEVDVDIITGRIDAILESNLVDAAKRIAAPCLVIAARDDYLVPRYLSDEVAAAIGGARYEVFDEGGHFLPRTDSRGYNAALDRFLSELGIPDSGDR